MKTKPKVDSLGIEKTAQHLKLVSRETIPYIVEQYSNHLSDTVWEAERLLAINTLEFKFQPLFFLAKMDVGGKVPNLRALGINQQNYRPLRS